jgi:rRNA maturation endonuclease Nob1
LWIHRRNKSFQITCPACNRLSPSDYRHCPECGRTLSGALDKESILTKGH